MGYRDNQNGLAAIISVIIIGIAGLMMATLAFRSGLADIDYSWLDLNGAQARYAAEGCAEDGIRRLQLNPDFIGAEFLMPDGKSQCLLDVSSFDDQRQITAIGQYDKCYKTISIQATVSSSTFMVDSWTEN